MVRVAGPQDIDWIIEVAKTGFGDLMKDIPATRQWLTQVMSLELIRIFRTDKAFVIAMCGPLFFDPAKRFAVAEYMAGNIWDWPKLLKSSAKWAKTQGAEELIFKPTTEIDPKIVDFIVKKSSLVPDFPTFKMRLT